MNLTKLLLTFILLMLQLFALWSLFVAVVGELKTSNEAEASEKTNDFYNSNVSVNMLPVEYSSKVSKIVFIIIDAMRFDFVSHMKFIENLLNDGNNACIFKVSLDGPTVTLPRVKALVSGAPSSYWDVLTNLKQSSSITNDNFIWRANSADKRVVFYGDDTWLKLFPKNEFTRHEGVTSFFVTDFYEVDNNVTRNVYTELDKMDFDMMILHYLGVDHVGHVHGPRHSLIPVKLEEMNSIVEKIYKTLEVADSRSPHVIFITGDHGMANQGGHGGDSLDEVTSPLVVLTVNPSQGQNKIRTCARNKARWKESPHYLKQVDIPAIISYLWGLPFPENSRGQVPPEILEESSLNSQLDVLIYNMKHLSKFLSHHKKSDKAVLRKMEKLFSDHTDFTTLSRNNLLAVIANHQSLLFEIKSAAVQVSNQDIPSMLFSSVLLLQTAVLLVLVYYTEFLTTKMNAIILAVLLLASFYAPTVLPSAPSSIVILVTLIAIYLASILYSRTMFVFRTNVIIQHWNELDKSIVVAFIYFSSAFLYASSSFVEEEHFASYFIYSSVIVLSMVLTWSRTFSPRNLYSFLLVLVIHRFCSDLNATGQKWNYMLDLNDVLREYKLTELVAVLAMVLIFIKMSTTIEKISVILIAAYKLRVINLIQEADQSSEHWEAKLCYVFILASLVMGKFTRNTQMVENFWVLLSSLLQRRENIILIPLVSYQVNLIRTSLMGKNYKFAVILINLLLFCSFFYQGNSNNITTIDISLGYTGLSTYNEYIVGTLTFVGTYALPVLVIVLTTSRRTGEECLKCGSSTVSSGPMHNDGYECNSYFHTAVVQSLVMKITVTNLVYAIVLIMMRQHLFIWSVFVPKLLALIAFQLLVTIIVFIFIMDRCAQCVINPQGGKVLKKS